MRPSRKRTPIVVWLALCLIAGGMQVPLIAVYYKSATAERTYKVERKRRVVRVTVRPNRRPKKKKEAPVVEVQPKGQVVTVREPEIEVPPPRKTKYLSNANTRVPKEVKARPNRRRSKRRMGAAAPKRVSKVQSPRSRSQEESAAQKVAPQMELPAKTVKAPKTARGDSKPDTELVRSHATKVLMPTLDKQSALANLQALTGSSSSDDALLDVKERGEETLLNSRKFQHWDFFNTVKNRVRKHWHPASVYRRRDPTGKVYGIKDRLTVVQVTLSANGKLQRLTTVKDSGVDFLDVEARRALRKAAPFTNPPTGLVNKHNAITFQFGFLFEISSSRFKFFRMPM